MAAGRISPLANSKGSGFMPDYKKMYHIMFNAATDAERMAAEAERLAKKSSEILRKAQQECEKIYLEADNEPITLQPLTHDIAAEK